MHTKQKLTAEEVKHIAKLSGLILNESEVKKFEKQLTATLSYVDILGLLKTNTIEPTDHVGKMVNIYREDEITSSLSQDEVLRNIKDSYQGFFKVNAVLEEK